MKKVFLFALATAMMSFAGCQQMEQEAPVNPNEGGSTFEFVAEIAQTKTTLEAGTYKVEWEAEDVIYMVTAGENTPWAKATEFTYADGKFNTETELAAGNYTMNALYAASSQAQYHKNTGTTHKLQSVQTQDCENRTAHIKDNDALVGTFTATVPMAEVASVNMNHIYTLMQVDVKNNTGAEINITKFEMTVPGADLAGIFTVDFETAGVETASGAAETITVNVENGTVAAGGSLPVYFVAAPFTSDAEKGVEFKVTTESGATYTKTAKVALTFNAGEYNTTPYTISVADELVWTLVTNVSDLAVGDEIIIAAKDDNYALGAASSNGNNRTQVAITKSDDTLTSIEDATVLTLQSGTTSDSYSLFTGSKYLCAASSSANHLKEKDDKDANGSWKITISTDGTASLVAQGTYTRNTMQYNQSSGLFACYSSASQKALAIYKQMPSSGEAGGTTPDPEEPETPDTPTPGSETTVTMTSFSATSASMDGNVSYSTAKGGGTSAPAVNDGEIRLYQNSSGGGSITITVKDGYKLQSVTIGSSMKTKVAYTKGDGTTKSASSDLVANGKYTVDDIAENSITFHCMGGDKNSRLYVNYLSVTYQAN